MHLSCLDSLEVVPDPTLLDDSLKEEKRSRLRRRDFCGIWEWRGKAGRLRLLRKVVSRRTEEMEFVKIKILEC